jgi:hypothetical protein
VEEQVIDPGDGRLQRAASTRVDSATPAGTRDGPAPDPATPGVPGVGPAPDPAKSIRLAETSSHFEGASILVNKMYSWRGYGDNHRLAPDPNRITLTATEQSGVVGTMSVSVDAHAGLAADQLFKDELDVYRLTGARLCELTKLAVDPSARSKFTLANLFHFALVYARDLHGCTDAVMEINPRHRGFYHRMMGFRQQCEPRSNLSVNAPACLMHIRIEEITRQVLQHGGHAARSDTRRGQSFYEFFKSPDDEDLILNCFRSASG